MFGQFMRVLFIKNNIRIFMNFLVIGIIAIVITNICICCFLHNLDISSIIITAFYPVTLTTITINILTVTHSNIVKFRLIRITSPKKIARRAEIIISE